MAKSGSLSKIEKFYIEGHTDLPIEDIARELNRSVKIVQKYLDTIEKPKPTKKRPKNTHFQQLMGTKERNGQKVATVMTKGASELADSKRSKRLVNKKTQQAIYRPNK